MCIYTCVSVCVFVLYISDIYAAAAIKEVRSNVCVRACVRVCVCVCVCVGYIHVYVCVRVLYIFNVYAAAPCYD